MEESKKRWPLGLIKRGVRVASTVPDVIWWQEPEPPAGPNEIRMSTIEAAMSIGYEAYYFVPLGYSEKLAEAGEDLLREITEDGLTFEEACDHLATVIESYRQNVSKPEVVNG